MKYLGMDLGTANTYLYGCNSIADMPMPIIIPGISDNNGSISTVVLYENEKPILIGNVAEEEYFLHPDLQAKRFLAAQFKPEVGLNDPEAIKVTQDFLRLLRNALNNKILESDTAITVGIPALAREDFKINLRQCFIHAGWKSPDFARESDAALVSCLQQGLIEVDDLDQKCLIMDFGGGTCDYTSMESLNTLQHGGDVLYGGRLFDDLFFETFCKSDSQLAQEAPSSPYTWYAHWLECREQKEKFSDFIAAHPEDGSKISLKINWFDRTGLSHTAFVHDYDKTRFMQDAENYTPSQNLLAMLSSYANRGGLSQYAQDIVAGKNIGLIEWMNRIYTSVDRPREIRKVILTGGSSRWPFVHELAKNHFLTADIVFSSRGYEDIAFGLTLFPLLDQSRAAAARLLQEKLPAFSKKALSGASRIIKQYSEKIIQLCAQRMVHRDIMPVLEAAQKESMTAAQLEEKFAENIREDKGLIAIVQENSEELHNQLEEELNSKFKYWLRDNGVPLAPKFDFPARSIGEEFFDNVSIKISRLDSLNLMAFTLKKVLPLLAATATAGIIAHTGEPVSTVLGGGAAFGATWLLARTAPGFLENRKLPSFILNESNRKKIADKNREHIEAALASSLRDIRQQLSSEVEKRFRDTLTAMLSGLTALNQVQKR